MLMRVLRIALRGPAIAAPTIASAVGLGKLIVESVQGQPLKARIEIDAKPHELTGDATAVLAPARAYRGTGLVYRSVLDNVRISVDRRDGSRRVIALTSRQPVNRPYLDIIVELNTASGRVSRTYTLLVPPAVLAVAAPKPPAPVTAPPPPRATRRAVAPVVAATPPAGREPALAPPTAPRTHQVVRGDTLRSIARANRFGEVTVSQMMVAIFRANQDAFLGHDMNRLCRGSTLTIPGARAASATSAGEARDIVRAQVAQSEARHVRLAESRAATAQAPAVDTLGVARSDGDGDGQAANHADKQTRQVRNVEDVNTRAIQLEKDPSSMRELVELRNARVARLEAQDVLSTGTKAPTFSIPGGRRGGSTAFAKFRKSQPCPAAGGHEPCIGYVIAYVVPICAGGADAASNLQWFTVEAALRKERADHERGARNRTTRR